MKSFKIGDVAKRAGVSVRTLHYYEEIGLLHPSERTSTGHRRYGRSAIERLQQIKSLQQMGMSLSEIEALFQGQEASPQDIVKEHLTKINEQRAALEQVERQLQRLLQHLEGNVQEDVESIEVLFSAMEAMNRYEDILTPKQWNDIQAQHESAQEAGRNEWDRALQELRQEMELGTPPDSPRVLRPFLQWQQSLQAFLPSSETSLHTSMMKIFQLDTRALQEHGLDPALFDYIQEAYAVFNNED